MTNMDSQGNDKSDPDYKKINQDEESDLGNLNDLRSQPKKVKSMEVYEMLQDPEKRFVLTNIKAFIDNTMEQAEPKEIQNDLISVKINT